MEPIALTIPDAVKAAGVSRTSLYEALRRGELSARKNGKRTLIEAEALKAWLAQMPAYEPARAA